MTRECVRTEAGPVHVRRERKRVVEGGCFEAVLWACGFGTPCIIGTLSAAATTRSVDVTIESSQSESRANQWWWRKKAIY